MDPVGLNGIRAVGRMTQLVLEPPGILPGCGRHA